MVFHALRSGFSLARRYPGLVLLLLGTNLLFAALLTAPLYRQLMDSIGYSREGALLLEGFQSVWLAEFRFAHPDFFPAMNALLLPAGILYFLLQCVLSGGIIELCIRRDARRGWARTFFRGTADHALPFLRIGIAAAAVLLLAHWLMMTKLHGTIEGWIEQSPRVSLEFALDTALPFSTILVIIVIDMIFDYARIQKVRCALPSAALATVGAVRFCGTRPGGTAALCASMLLLTGLLHGLYLFVYALIPQNDLTGILLLFVVQEAWMAARIFLRIAAWAGQAEYHRMSGAVGAPREG